VSFSIALVVFAAAQASVVAVPSSSKVADTGKNVRVCQTIGEVGSRLKSHRVCMLKSEWAEQRRSDKMLIDRTQLQRGVEMGH
jgi:hypothetical protein